MLKDTRAAFQAARRVVEENETTILSNRDRDLLLKTLDKPPVLSSTLKAALKKYRQWK